MRCHLPRCCLRNLCPSAHHNRPRSRHIVYSNIYLHIWYPTPMNPHLSQDWITVLSLQEDEKEIERESESCMRSGLNIFEFCSHVQHSTLTEKPGQQQNWWVHREGEGSKYMCVYIYIHIFLLIYLHLCILFVLVFLGCYKIWAI